MMRPYPGKSEQSEKIFNYRLSRARRVIENTFGLLKTRWRIFSRPIKASVKSVDNFALGAIALHSYLRQTHNGMYCKNRRPRGCQGCHGTPTFLQNNTLCFFYKTQFFIIACMDFMYQ